MTGCRVYFATVALVIGLAGCSTTSVPVSGRSFEVLKKSQVALAADGFDVEAVDVDRGTIALTVKGSAGKFTDADRLDVRVKPFGDSKVRERKIVLEAYSSEAMFLPSWTGRDGSRERGIESRAARILTDAFAVAGASDAPALGAVKGADVGR
jgi:hypothetical protein